MSALKARITEDLKAAMKSGDTGKRDTLRLITAALKQREVDERIVLSDAQVLEALTRMLKQRRDSISQFQTAGRQDLVDKEVAEVAVIELYMPAGLSEAEIDQLVEAAVAEAGATSAKEMGKVMALLKPQIAGRADMQQVSARIKARLG